jgi:hypothetical protein
VDDAAGNKILIMTWSRQKAGLLEGYTLSEINKYTTNNWGSAACHGNRRKEDTAPKLGGLRKGLKPDIAAVLNESSAAGILVRMFRGAKFERMIKEQPAYKAVEE